jgi:outer membrane lipoprotein SlyB
MKRPIFLVPVLLFAACANCANQPAGPSAEAMPGAHKTPGQFTYDQTQCRQYASAQTDGGAHDANVRQSIASAVTTAIGAAAGAAFGGGHGAALGAGAGLLAGVGGSSLFAADAGRTLQQQYDGAFNSCMAARHNMVPMSVQVMR